LLHFLSQGVTAQDSVANNGPDSLDREKKVRFLALPVITYAPETRLRLGASGLLYFRPGKNLKEGTQLSTVRMPITYTLNKQFKLRLSYDIFLSANKHIFSGFQEWFRFPLLFWGIGSNTEDSAEELYTTQAFAFRVNYLNKLSDRLFIGAGYDLRTSVIVDKDPDGQLATEGLIPGADGGTVSGLNILVRRDNRDNVMSAAKGSYLQARIGYYVPWIGSDFTYTTMEVDYRIYFPVLQGRHVLAVQALHSNNVGDPGFETMALLGGDEIMRGHFQGRFRDKGINAIQAEYRIPIGRKNWVDEREKMPFFERFGIVGFAGIGHVYPRFQDMDIKELKESYGFGFRWLAIPEERINIRIDVGFGTERPGFYFQIRESF
jgi:outer membrane protein assembly factor BamA